VGAVTVTISKMSAGKGYEYFLRTVAAGDGDRSLSTPLTRYYTEEGTPPGRWMGSGIASLDSPLKVGDEVTEEQLRLLIGEAWHPVTGQDLGRRYRTYKVAEEGKRRHPVAGYDLTFSIPKSASVLWGVSDAGTQAIIADAHHLAVAETIEFLEREVIATRGGARGPNGGVAQLDVTGVIATAFDHYDSRANDPHLHTHVVISNRVKATCDGQWRTIDGAPAAHLDGGRLRTPRGDLQRPPHPHPRRRLGTTPSRTRPKPRLGDHRRAAVVGRTLLQPLPRHQRRD
jgi:conjugative relaxase-like TrwC/TraI family protein